MVQIGWIFVINTINYLGLYTTGDQIISMPERKLLRFLLPRGVTLHIFCVEGGFLHNIKNKYVDI